MVCMWDKSKGDGRMPRDAGVFSECEVMIPDDTAFQVRSSWYGRLGLPVKALARDTTRRLRFVFHAAEWLNSMVLHRRVSVLNYADVISLFAVCVASRNCASHS